MGRGVPGNRFRMTKQSAARCATRALHPPRSLAFTRYWQLQTAFHHGELGLVKRPLLVRRPTTMANFNGTLLVASVNQALVSFRPPMGATS